MSINALNNPAAVLYSFLRKTNSKCEKKVVEISKTSNKKKDFERLWPIIPVTIAKLQVGSRWQNPC